MAHAVCHDAALLGCTRHHISAWAHAEGVYTPAAALIRKVVFRSAKARMPCKSTELAFIDHFPRVLDPHTGRKGLCLHQNAARRQHTVCIGSAVANRENTCRAWNALPPGIALHMNRAEGIAIPLKAGQARFEAHLSAHAQDRKAHILYDLHQLIRPDMRLCHRTDLLRSTMLREDRNDLLRTRILDARGEFPVGKRAGAAFAKHGVAHFAEQPLLPEARHIRPAGIHIPAALEHDRAISVLRKQICRKKAGRPHADHDDGRIERLRAKGKRTRRFLRRAGNAHTRAAQCARLVFRGKRERYGIAETDLVFPTRIQRNAVYAQPQDRTFRHSKSPRRKLFERGLIRLKR